MANRQAEHLDNGTSLGDSGFDMPKDIVNPLPGLDLDLPILNPGKMTSYESPSYECAAPKTTVKPKPRESMLFAKDGIAWLAICALVLVVLLVVATRSTV